MRDAERDNARKRALYEERKLSQRCTGCGASLLPEWDGVCPECLEARKAVERRYGRSAKGLRKSRLSQRRRRETNPEQSRQWQRARRLAHKVNGICVVCSELATDGGWCDRHAAIARAASKAYRISKYIEWRDAGLCVRCGGERDRGGTSCFACRAIGRRSAAKRRREMRTEWAALGLCMECGGEKQRPGSTCDGCRERNAARTAKLRAQLAAADLCIRCGKWSPGEGFTQCRECREKLRTSRERRAA